MPYFQVEKPYGNTTNFLTSLLPLTVKTAKYRPGATLTPLASVSSHFAVDCIATHSPTFR
jgi:hypothetical protein